MEAYPKDYTAHNVPLVILSGLGSEALISKYIEHDPAPQSGTRVHCDIPLVDSEAAESLFKVFVKADGSSSAWKTKSAQALLPVKLRFIGRSYRLPPRKAAPPSPHSSPSPPSSPQSTNVSRASTPVLHSPLSPLSPSSPTFPDGLMTPKWIHKHQDILPSCFLLFITFALEDEDAAADDLRIQAELNKWKASLDSVKYRGRVCVVALGQTSVLDDSKLDGRIESLRKACSLDRKQFFFLPPGVGPVEVETFVMDLLKSIETGCIEYYRDLSKHSRRKRNRGSIPAPTAPPTSGTSRVLSHQGWSIRYLFKLGIFAEFRQEMDAAGRNYNEAYDLLFSQDIFGSIASWSPRWNEARLLADSLAIRMIRCHLWNEQTTHAVKRWRLHRANVQKMVDERGLGSSTYGWHAWESLWAMAMAQLILKAEVSSFFNEASDEEASQIIFAPPEKTVAMGDRIHPHEYMHHPGYWYKIANGHTMVRRRLAADMPEEDRASPGQSPASRVANRAYTYDTYLCPQPHIEAPLPGHSGFNHSKHLIHLLQLAFEEFESQSQPRACEELQLAVGKEHLVSGNSIASLQALRPLWQNCRWRKEGWWLLLSDLCWNLYEAASRAGDGASIVSTRWELMSTILDARRRVPYDFHRVLDGATGIKSKPYIVLRQGDVVSFLQISFSFKQPRGHVGEYVSAQLAITSTAHSFSLPVTLSEIRIEFSGSLRHLLIRHVQEESSTNDPIVLKDVTLLTTSTPSSSPPGSPRPFVKPRLHGEADLTVAPGTTHVFNMNIPLREEGDGKAITASLSINEKLFDLEYVADLSSSKWSWWNKTDSGYRKSKVAHGQPCMISVLPRPPKLQLLLPNMRKHYYTNESVNLNLTILNGEESQSIVTLEARLQGKIEEGLKISWDQSSDDVSAVDEDITPDSQTRLQSNLELGTLSSEDARHETLRLSPISTQAEILIEIKALYHLDKDPETIITKTITVLLPIIGPFEANYDFSPRVHPDRWPNYFKIATADMLKNLDKLPEPKGLAQKWCLTSHLTSFSDETLIIDNISIRTEGVQGGGSCEAISTSEQTSTRKILPNEQEADSFDVVVQKDTMEDRRLVLLDFSLIVNWRRDEENAIINSTPLPIPRLSIHMAEPRVLATVKQSATVQGLIYLEYTFENPTMHLLTFNLSMEPNEDFAISGLRAFDLQLVPLSRETIRYNLMPFISGTWIQPVLRVVDPYFKKTLKVSGTEGMRSDKKGLYFWVDAVEG